jgi:hypothetical protein
MSHQSECDFWVSLCQERHAFNELRYVSPLKDRTDEEYFRSSYSGAVSLVRPAGDARIYHFNPIYWDTEPFVDFAP